MQYQDRLAAQSGADRLPGHADDAEVRGGGHGDGVDPLATGRFEDGTPTPEAFRPAARCRFACPECHCARKRCLSAASDAGSPAQQGTFPTGNRPRKQVRKGRPKRALSTLFSWVSGRRLDLMSAHTLEQPADLLRTATFRDPGPLPTPKHLVRYVPRCDALLSAGFSPRP